MALVGHEQVGHSQIDLNEMGERPEFSQVSFPVCLVIQKENDIQKRFT